MNIDENTYAAVISTLDDVLERKIVTKAKISRDTQLSPEWITYFSKGEIADAGWNKVFKIYQWLTDNNFPISSFSDDSKQQDVCCG